MGCTNWNISVCVWPLPRLGNLRFILEDNSNINLIFDFFLFFRIFWFLGFFIFSFFSFFWFFCFFWFFFEFFDYFNPMGLCIPEGPTPYKLAAPIEIFQSVYDRCQGWVTPFQWTGRQFKYKFLNFLIFLILRQHPSNCILLYVKLGSNLVRKMRTRFPNLMRTGTHRLIKCIETLFLKMSRITLIS